MTIVADIVERARIWREVQRIALMRRIVIATALSRFPQGRARFFGAALAPFARLWPVQAALRRARWEPACFEPLLRRIAVRAARCPPKRATISKAAVPVGCAVSSLIAAARDGPAPAPAKSGPVWAKTRLARARRWENGRGESVAPPTMVGRSLVLVAPGGDPRRLSSSIPPGAQIVLASLGAPAFGAPAGVAVIARDRLRMACDHTLGEPMRAVARAALDWLTKVTCPALAQALATFAAPLENELTAQIDRYLLQAQDAGDLSRALAPDRTVILSGEEPVAPILARLTAAGVEPTAVLVWGTAAPPRLDASADPGARALWDDVQNLARRYARSKAGGQVLIYGGSNDRHAPAALAVAQRFARHHPTRLIATTDAAPLSLVKAAAKAGLRLDLVPAFSLSPPALAWTGRRATLTARMLAAAEPVIAGDAALRAAAQAGLERFVDRLLPQMLAAGEALRASFAADPPVAVALAPATSTLAMTAGAAARAVGVPTGQIQTLLTQANGREYAPIAEIVGVIDDSQAQLHRDYFGVAAERLILTGYPDAFAPQARPLRSSPASQERVLLFIGQTIPEATLAALDLVCKAAVAAPGWRVHVHAHPRESDEQIEAEHAILKASTLGTRGRHLGRGASSEALRAAGAVAGLYSNVLLHAAAAGLDVLVVDPGAVGYPFELWRSGAALRICDFETACAALDDLRTAGPYARRLAETRAAYLKANQQLVDRTAGLDKFVSRLAADVTMSRLTRETISL